MDKVMVGRTPLIGRVHAHGRDKGSIVEGDATDSDGLEELGRVLVLLVLIVIEERTDGLWLLWEEGGVALDLSGGVWEDVGHGESAVPTMAVSAASLLSKQSGGGS